LTDWYLAGDLGGTKMAAALVDGNGNVVFRAVSPTRAGEGIQAVTARFTGLLQKVIAGAGEARIRACGVAALGLVDAAAGEILFAANLPGSENYPLRRRLQAELPVPVFVDNDLRLHALGEITFGAASQCCHFLFVAVGTGVGSALFLNGQFYRGAHSSAGEIGHIPIDSSPEAPRCGCGRRGCLEALASGPAIAARFSRLARAAGLDRAPQELTLKEIASWIDRPDLSGQLARQAITEGAQALGRGLAIAANLLDLERVILGGGVSRIGGFWLEAVRQAAAGLTLHPLGDSALRLAQLGDEAALVGAAVLARNRSA
jgi:glucokinase